MWQINGVFCPTLDSQSGIFIHKQAKERSQQHYRCHRGNDIELGLIFANKQPRDTGAGIQQNANDPINHNAAFKLRRAAPYRHGELLRRTVPSMKEQNEVGSSAMGDRIMVARKGFIQ